jgi:hypothetical protein
MILFYNKSGFLNMTTELTHSTPDHLPGVRAAACLEKKMAAKIWRLLNYHLFFIHLTGSATKKRKYKDKKGFCDSLRIEWAEELDFVLISDKNQEKFRS